jgi:hypothetical protein
MRALLIFTLSFGLVFTGCRKRKTTSAPEAAPEAPAPAATPAAAAGSPPPTAPAPVNVVQLEAEVEFSELNNVIASFEAFHKRMPTVEDLKKSYFGGTRPLPIPPGYKLVIDQKKKKAKLVPGN